MFYTYIIRSQTNPVEFYVGATSDLKKRLNAHNSGQVSHTSKFAPWRLECYTAFNSREQAYEFEKYLKSHSGRAFFHKRMIDGK